MGAVMENAIKVVKINLMFCLLVLACSCQQTKSGQIGQQDTIASKKIKTVQKKEPRMRKFDVDNYEKQMIANPLYEGKTLEDGSHVKEYYIPKPNVDAEPFTRKAAELFVERIEHKNGFNELISYYNNGNIHEYNNFFSIELEVGIWKYYDEQGNLTKTVDKDLGYKFTLNDVIAFGKKNDVDFHHDGNLQRGFSDRFKKNVWTVSWIEDLPAGDRVEHVCILDGDNGTVLERKKEDAPIRKVSR
ncbi:hypothetical protein [Pedobacter miscanthi]|uniref:hypothetical protein n=1 Tax=Pedobacter miscanthi TaxID=2259170 RepID=UPI00292F4C8C|nr:hypothetical protein [Pedobacter miscanthi]